jgi:hypothetical protein
MFSVRILTNVMAVTALLMGSSLSLAQSSGGGGGGAGGGGGGTSSGGAGGGTAGSSGGTSAARGTLSPVHPCPSLPAIQNAPQTTAPGSPGVTPQRNDSARDNPATDTEIPGTTDTQPGVSAKRAEPSPSTSGAVPQGNTQAPIGPDRPVISGGTGAVAGGGTVAGGGGSPRKNASGQTLEECMAAWDEATHMSQSKWRETCERTLVEQP